MTETQAREIVRWTTGDAKSPADYGKSYKQSEIEESFAMCGRELPAWARAAKREVTPFVWIFESRAAHTEHETIDGVAKAIGEAAAKLNLLLDAVGLQ